LRTERWGSPLVQERYGEGKACDKRHPYRKIIIITIIIIITTEATTTLRLLPGNNKLVSHEGKVTILWNQQCKQTEKFITINRTS
jgi:hypothetical protein